MISHAFLKSLACEQQTHFRKCVCCSQAMKSQTPRNFGAVGFVSKKDINRKTAQPKENGHRISSNPTILLAYRATCRCHQMWRFTVSLVSRWRQQSIEITKPKSLASDFSRFLEKSSLRTADAFPEMRLLFAGYEKSNSTKFWSCRVRFQERYQ